MASLNVELNNGGISIRTCDVFNEEYNILQDATGGNHGLVVWDAAIFFCLYLQVTPKIMAGMKSATKILELGAGTGLLSMALANQGCHLICTDLPSVIPNLQVNVNSNVGTTPHNGGSLKVVPYCWGDDIQEIMSYGPYDYIIGTDVAYGELTNPVLVQSAAKIAASSDAAFKEKGIKSKCTVYFANELRCSKAQSIFDAEAEKVFTSQKIPTKQFPDDYKTKECNMLLFKMRAKRGVNTNDDEANDN